MVGAFGEKLRKQRELRGIELDAISNTTKISTRMLRALEDEHFDQLPGGVFNKGFVRAYARQVGLSEEEAVTDYLAALRESQILQQSILPDFRAPAGKPSGTPAPEIRSDLRNPDLRNPDFRSDELPGRDLRNSDRRDPGVRTDPPGPEPPAQLRKEEIRKDDRGRNTNEDRRNPQRDLSPPPDSARPAPHPPAEPPPRPRYSAGDPGEPPSNPSDLSVQVPWGKLAAALLLA